MLRGNLDAAPFVMVFFLLLIFVLLGSLVYTPGFQLALPTGADLPGTATPSISVAVDPKGRLYFQNQLIDAKSLTEQLRAAVATAPEPLTLIVHADRDVTYDNLVRITMLARTAGIQEAFLATMPRLFPSGATQPIPSP